MPKFVEGSKWGETTWSITAPVLGGAPQDLSFDPKIDSGVIIGDDNNFREHVTISRSTKVNGNTIIGDRNFFMAVSHIAHDVIVGDDNIFANNVMIAGHVRIANKVFLGGGTAIHQFTHVGDFAMSQGNSTLTKDVPPYCVAHKINQLSAA